MTCSLCNNIDAQSIESGEFDGSFIQCPNCGNYRVSGSLAVRLEVDLADDEIKRALISHRVRQMQRSEGEPPLLTTYLFDRIVGTEALPTPNEQIDLMMQYLGANSLSPQQRLQFNPSIHNAVIGAIGGDGLHYIAAALEQLDLVTVSRHTMDGSFEINLTMAGWERYSELKKGASVSRKAFIAMKFGDPELDRFVDDVFRPAVEQTGFKLVRLDDSNPAGLIDDRLRVEIQTSRFLLADLTHSNNGAYWEAGYAEGLGKAVIYTCKQDAFDNSGTHFDTNHHLTIMWNLDNPTESAERLKATIRATLPADAKMEDD